MVEEVVVAAARVWVGAATLRRRREDAEEEGRGLEGRGRR
jgi:hypothetical protein